MGGDNLHIAAIHFHCYAPTCLAVEIVNNNTGELLCRQEPVYGGPARLTCQSLTSLAICFSLHAYGETHPAWSPCLWPVVYRSQSGQSPTTPMATTGRWHFLRLHLCLG